MHLCIFLKEHCMYYSHRHILVIYIYIHLFFKYYFFILHFHSWAFCVSTGSKVWLCDLRPSFIQTPQRSAWSAVEEHCAKSTESWAIQAIRDSVHYRALPSLVVFACLLALVRFRQCSLRADQKRKLVRLCGPQQWKRRNEIMHE